jgi:hypothetical protein
MVFLRLLIPRLKYSEVSPSIAYRIVSPYFNSMVDERQHRQIANKAFEAKSSEALIRYLDENRSSFHELDRTVDGKSIAERESVFELEGGEIWF